MKMIFEVPALDAIASALVGINQTLKSAVIALERIEVAILPPQAARIIFFEVLNNETNRLGGNMFQKVTENKKFAISITDRFGNPAKVDGDPQWALTDSAAADLVVEENGTVCTVIPKGPLVACKLQVSADADMGEGVKALLGEMDLEFVAGDAEVITIGEIPIVVEPPVEPPVEEPVV
jgi:hypothetical protein